MGFIEENANAMVRRKQLKHHNPINLFKYFMKGKDYIDDSRLRFKSKH